MLHFPSPPVASSSLLFQNTPEYPADDPEQQEDQFVSPFLQHALGMSKYKIFSTSPANKKTKHKKALVTDYLLKAEIMKQVMCDYTPEISNDTRYFSHPWSGSPTGRVTLNRATILQLSGWSSVQFSNWSRRSLSVAALCHYDARLKDIANAIESRLRAFASPSYILASNLGLDYMNEITEDTEKNTHFIMTARTLDSIIDDLKHRSYTGIIQFLCDQRSSLEDFISQKTFARAVVLAHIEYLQEKSQSVSSVVFDDLPSTEVSTPALSDTVSTQAVPTPPVTPPNTCDDQSQLSYSSL
ncbi:hypothetical protein D9758_003197 [Tetrapyrgos nigripes]|uniref:Uncharacterized protein n=1 Tax=Tetrapyrgos nigripes TaxID=182062 RepID=A0A8H5GII2_9AGAR|nr:hypothetical protein D9758_003197 [Tetrapyrgos nigripes]